MNRKKDIEWIFATLLIAVLFVILLVLSEQKDTIKESLIEKENVISDMEEQLYKQISFNENLKKQVKETNVQLKEVLESFDEVNAQLEGLKKENQALRSQNKELKDKVSALEKESSNITVSRSNSSSVAKQFYVEATAYTAYCKGCSGITATGINLRDNPNMKVIAVDPKVIPLGTKVWVEGYGYAVAGDTGGAIKGNKIDVFIPSKEDAYKWGRKNVLIKVLQ